VKAGLIRFDKLGVAIAALIAISATLPPFATFSANRIVLGEPRSIWSALPEMEAVLLIAILVAVAWIALLRTPSLLRLCGGLVAVAALLVLIGRAGEHLTPDEDTFARVSPGSGFWLLLFVFGIFVADALTRLRLSPVKRLAGLAAALAALALLLASGGWDSLSILKEYETRAASFWREGRTHLLLAFGSLALATLAGVPLGVLAQRSFKLRGPLLNLLNIIQTIPSIALFGLLIAPLAWIAANVPGAGFLGVSGIGAAPALVALFAYSLLPVVSNTVVGLDGVPRQTTDAATGMGMTDWQKLVRVETPLAFPVILTGIRIVLVQNIGLATIAALIGGGGFGVFVFQGMGQTATDLILLGAVPTVLLAFAAAVVLDAFIELSERPGAKEASA
jgi:osmoprotectant transport system permease protein